MGTPEDISHQKLILLGNNMWGIIFLSYIVVSILVFT